MGKRKKKQKDLVDEVLCGATAEQVARWCAEGRAAVEFREESTGRTALMTAAAQANHKVVCALLELRANLCATDVRGETVFHHLTHKNSRLPRRIKTLLALLQDPTARTAINAANHRGKTPLVALYGLVRVARNAAASSGEHRRAEEAEVILSAFDPKGERASLPDAAGTEAAWWADKLGEALADDVAEVGGRYNGGYQDAEEADVWTHTHHVDAVYDNQSARPPTRRKVDLRPDCATEAARSGLNAGEAPTVPPWLRERARLQEEMRARDQAQREASTRIIEEEKRKTEVLRHRKKSAHYQLRAEAFFGGTTVDVKFTEVPWPGSTVDEVKGALIGYPADSSVTRKLLKRELMRWHPDRWSGTTIARVVEADRDAVLKRVQSTSQILNSLLGEQ